MTDPLRKIEIQLENLFEKKTGVLSAQLVHAGKILARLIEALEDEMMGIIEKTARQQALSGTAKGIEIKACKLGDDAGITGAAFLARRCTKKD